MAMPFYKERMPFRNKCSIMLCLLNVANVTSQTAQTHQMALVLAQPQPALHIAKTIYCQIHQFK